MKHVSTDDPFCDERPSAMASGIEKHMKESHIGVLTLVIFMQHYVLYMTSTEYNATRRQSQFCTFKSIDLMWRTNAQMRSKTALRHSRMKWHKRPYGVT